MLGSRQSVLLMVLVSARFEMESAMPSGWGLATASAKPQFQETEPMVLETNRQIVATIDDLAATMQRCACGDS